MFYHQLHNSRSNYNYNAFFYNNIHYTPHFHQNFELLYVLSGKVQCTAGTKSAVVCAGEFALFLCNEVHSLHSDGDSRCWIGVFSGDFVHAFQAKVRNLDSRSFIFRCEPSIHSFLLNNLIADSEPPLFLLKACLYAACNEYCNQVELRECSSKSELLSRAISDYIAENYRNKISLSTMAERLGYNYSYLSRSFHRIFRMSFPEFLNAYRLEAAMPLLRRTDLEIVQVAMECGFQSLRSFNACFKAAIGVTPSQYRVGRKPGSSVTAP